MRDEMSLGVVVTGRNNYQFMRDFFVPQFKRFPDVEVLNIDEESTKAQKRVGRAVCDAAGIKFIPCDVRGMQNNMRQACAYFAERGKRFIVYFQHDCWPYSDSFFVELDKIVRSGALDEFGAVGFNGLAADTIRNHGKHVRALRRGEFPLGVLARSPLDRYTSWYVGVKGGKTVPLRHPRLFRQPFAAEIPAWFAAGLNIDAFNRHAKPCSDYQFFHAWDDLAFQFLRANVHNVILPALYIEHRPDLKPESGLPKKSVKMAERGDATYHGHFNHRQIWFDRWGWHYERRGSFRAVQDKYKGTLINDFFAHDSKDGPLKAFDVPGGGLPWPPGH